MKRSFICSQILTLRVSLCFALILWPYLFIYIVAHRTRQFEAWLADRLENFNVHQQGQISRIPKQVRSMTMREFGEKYNGNVQEAVRGVQRERMATSLDANFAEIDKSERKRKWAASQEVESEASGSGSRKDATERHAAKNGMSFVVSFTLVSCFSNLNSPYNARHVAQETTACPWPWKCPEIPSTHVQ